MKSYKLEMFKDNRGIIQQLLPDGVSVKSAQYITGKAGAVRGQHYHKTDIHYCMAVLGQIRYSWKEGDEVKSKIMELGEVIANEPGELHKFEFVTSGVFISLALQPRDQEHYEEDVVRQSF